jgi:hypothetical protein
MNMCPLRKEADDLKVRANKEIGLEPNQYRIRRLRLSRLLLGQESRHLSSRIIRTFGNR